MIDRQAVEARQQPVATAGDVATQTDRVAGARRQRASVEVLEDSIHPPVVEAGADPMPEIRVGHDVEQSGRIDDEAGAVVVDEILVTMTTRSDLDLSGFSSRVDRLLPGLPHLVSIRGRGDPFEIRGDQRRSKP